MNKKIQNKVLDDLMQNVQCHLIEQMAETTYMSLKKAYLLGYENAKRELDI